MHHHESLAIEGHLRIFQLPDGWDEATYRYWWCGQEQDERGQFLSDARMSRREKERYGIHESHNLMTAQGLYILLSYLVQPYGTASNFAQYFGVGTGAISQVATADTTIATEIARVQPAGAFFITGNTQSITCFFGTGVGTGTWTNGGLFGNGATSTLGTGQLLTHSLLSYPKGAGVSSTLEYTFTVNVV